MRDPFTLVRRESFTDVAGGVDALSSCACVGASSGKPHVRSLLDIREPAASQ
jgi:hypothetical protein